MLEKIKTLCTSEDMAEKERMLELVSGQVYDEAMEVQALGIVINENKTDDNIYFTYPEKYTDDVLLNGMESAKERASALVKGMTKNTWLYMLGLQMYMNGDFDESLLNFVLEENEVKFFAKPIAGSEWTYENYSSAKEKYKNDRQKYIDAVKEKVLNYVTYEEV